MFLCVCKCVYLCNWRVLASIIQKPFRFRNFLNRASIEPVVAVVAVADNFVVFSQFQIVRNDGENFVGREFVEK